MNSEDFNCVYIPEKWIVTKDSIYAAQFAISIGLKYIVEEIEKWEKAEPSWPGYVNREHILRILNNEKIVCEQALNGLKQA